MTAVGVGWLVAVGGLLAAVVAADIAAGILLAAAAVDIVAEALAAVEETVAVGRLAVADTWVEAVWALDRQYCRCLVWEVVLTFTYLLGWDGA